MWLFDDEVYRNMRRDGNTLKVSRGMALHKMIRLITFSLGG
jgi:1,4-alpha-glucan branching enzyme